MTLLLEGCALVRQLSLEHGTTSQSEPILHFGVGEAKGPFTAGVRCPSGAVRTMRSNWVPTPARSRTFGEGSGQAVDDVVSRLAWCKKST